MNLTTDAWIPVVWSGGKPGTVSLCEAFERGEEIQDLALRPLERIAVMRLLICIAQVSLDGPADYDDWRACRSRIAQSAVEYLHHLRQAFELFGDGKPFLQVSNLKPVTSVADGDGEGSATSKLDIALATGNNPTLFDNAGGFERSLTLAQLALMLLTFQCFSPGGRIGVALWDGQQTPGNGSSNHAPCLAEGMLHTLLKADSLAIALHKNLLNRMQVEQLFGKRCWGRPVWEKMPKALNDSDAVRNATKTYLGRLVPLSRSIRIAADGRTLTLANGLEYPPPKEWREPCATIVRRTVRGEPTRAVLRASTEKAAWRELHALTVKAVGQNPGGPVALQNIASEEGAFDLWVGGLVASKSKPVDTTESVFHVPAAMLTDPGQMIYEKGVRYADSAEFRIRLAISAYHNALGDNLDRPEMKNRRSQIQRNATAQFWTDIEQAVPLLLEVVEKGFKGNWRDTAWGKLVWRCARAAYEHSCPHETPRQIRAYVLGLQRMFTALTEQRATETGMEIEE
jgi:CRISPR system Cascade subunit CasA